ncbi:MAG TPA: DUF4974 domain-containing protein [Gemmataceae bacterium]|nr:DUF4974 domain-containing protein [Gemmataceae bacterium]
MRSHFEFLLTALLFCLGAQWPVHADDVQAKLDKRIKVEKSIDAPLKDVLRYLSDQYGLKIEVDNAAFETEKLKDPRDMRARIPKMDPVFLDTMLRLALDSCNAVYEVRGDSIIIMPNRNLGKVREFPARSEAQKKAQKELAERVSKWQPEVEKEFEAPIKDIVEFLSDRFDITILIDYIELSGLGNNRARIKAGKTTFDDVMKQMLKDVDATYRVEPDYIRIVRKRQS